MNDITAEEMKAWRKAEGLTQEEFGNMLGWQKLVVTNIETGRRGISEAEQRLLKLLIRGEMPFKGRDSYAPQIDFSESEWAIMTRIAHREGYHSPRPWIVAKIRGYLAMCEPSAADLRAIAEEPTRYNEGKPRQDPA